MRMFRQFFGASTDEILRQLCAEIGGEFVVGGFWRNSRILLRHREWTVTLYNLFCDVLDQLCRVGAARERDSRMPI